MPLGPDGNKSGPTRLGFGLMLKFFEIEARFPEFVEESPQPAVEYVAELKKVRGKASSSSRRRPPSTSPTRSYAGPCSRWWVRTLRELVAEAKANEKVFEAKVRTTLRSSYSSYYRQMLPPLLNTLGFRCENTAYRPVMDALALLPEYADVEGKDPLPRRRRRGADGRRGAQGLARGGRPGLTALFWSNINPYGTFRLDMDKRLDLLTAHVPHPRTPPKAAGQDAEILIKRVHEMSADRYGPLFATDLEGV